METLAEQPVIAETELLEEPTYLFVDSIHAVREARAEVREQAEDLLEYRRHNSSTEFKHMPVDALSTAHAVLRARSEYGTDSLEYKERRAGLVLDCQRLLAEWYRKNTAEYFPPTRHFYDESTQEFYSNGFSIHQMTKNGLVPIHGYREEEDRRVNEHVEDATPQILMGLGHIAVGQAIRTVSECADHAINDMNDDRKNGTKHRGYFGYAPEIAKVMIRDIRSDALTNDRWEEQVGLPGQYLDHETFQIALEKFMPEINDMDKTELHGSQFIANDSLLGFVEHLDTVASEQWCRNIFMGEEVPADHPKDYDAFRQEALQRQADLGDLSETVANFVLELAEEDVDREQALGLVEDFVKLELLEIGKTDIEAARNMFDEKTAVGLQRVAELESMGDQVAADELMRNLEQEAPGGGFCGAGSCGLEGVNEYSEEGKSLSSKLDAKAGDKLVKDKERSCKNCGAKKLSYAYNSKKVHTYCEGCDTLVKKTN